MRFMSNVNAAKSCSFAPEGNKRARDMQGSRRRWVRCRDRRRLDAAPRNAWRHPVSTDDEPREDNDAQDLAQKKEEEREQAQKEIKEMEEGDLPESIED